jgi:hypothetical protein
MRRVLAVLLIAAALGCESPTDPGDDPVGPRGRLSGTVTIGPICPVEQPGSPCPTPPSAFAQRQIVVFTETRSRELSRVDIDSRGFYFIDLVPGIYTIDFRGVGIDSSKDLPKKVTISANLVTVLDVHIDTGIR